MNHNFTNNILMVRPANFGYNIETAENNAFQLASEEEHPADIKELARAEFDMLVVRLRSVGIGVTVFEDSDEVVKPDAVFPNNWFTTHRDGTVVTYPMFSPARRNERDPRVIDALRKDFEVMSEIPLESYESKGQFLEGTGSVVLDRKNKVAYACLSERTSKELFEEFCKRMDFKPMSFQATDPRGLPIYHTNVMMALGAGYVIVCKECIRDEEDRKKLGKSFGDCGLEIIDISFEQLTQFAGNMMQLISGNGQPLLAMSSSAFYSLTQSQKEKLKKYSRLLHSQIDIIEKYGGGSVRCMIAEIFLKPKS